MDCECLHGLSGIQASSGHAGGIQRKVHVGANGSARRIMRDACRSYARHLPKLFSTRSALAVQWRPPGGVKGCRDVLRGGLATNIRQCQLFVTISPALAGAFCCVAKESWRSQNYLPEENVGRRSHGLWHLGCTAIRGVRLWFLIPTSFRAHLCFRSQDSGASPAPAPASNTQRSRIKPK